MIDSIIIKPTAVFERPKRIIAGNIILSPKIFPDNIKVQVFLASGETRNIILHSMITSSPEAFKENLHGFIYSGDIIDEEDLAGDVLISNAPLHEAYQKYSEQDKIY